MVATAVPNRKPKMMLAKSLPPSGSWKNVTQKKYVTEVIDQNQAK
jgi:hypothetical protein